MTWINGFASVRLLCTAFLSYFILLLSRHNLNFLIYTHTQTFSLPFSFMVIFQDICIAHADTHHIHSFLPISYVSLTTLYFNDDSHLHVSIRWRRQFLLLLLNGYFFFSIPFTHFKIVAYYQRRYYIQFRFLSKYIRVLEWIIWSSRISVGFGGYGMFDLESIQR